jgi:hypothetical protein
MEENILLNTFYNFILDAYPDMELGDVYKYKIENKEIHLLEFANVPVVGYKTFITNGLRKFPMTQVESQRQIKQELIFSIEDNSEIKSINVIFGILLRRMLTVNSKPYLRGELIFYEGFIWDKYKFDSFVCYEPLYLEERFVDILDLNKIIPVQLYPLFKVEREFIESRGHETFFEIVYDLNLDLMDLERKPIS